MAELNYNSQEAYSMGQLLPRTAVDHFSLFMKCFEENGYDSPNQNFPFEID